MSQFEDERARSQHLTQKSLPEGATERTETLANLCEELIRSRPDRAKIADYFGTLGLTATDDPFEQLKVALKELESALAPESRP